MKNINICFDCMEQFEKNDSPNHNNCKHKIILNWEKFHFNDKDFRSVKIKEHIYFGQNINKFDKFEIELIKVLMKKKFVKNTLIYTFKNKENSDNFCKENIMEIEHHKLNSGYTYIQDLTNTEGMILVNKSGIDLQTLSFIIDSSLCSFKLSVSKDIENKIKINS